MKGGGDACFVKSYSLQYRQGVPKKRFDFTILDIFRDFVKFLIEWDQLKSMH